MTEPTFPYGYARPPGGGPQGMGTMLTRTQLEAKQCVYKLHPEFWRRTIALMEYAWTQGVALGVGDGWRVQPDPPPPGFAPAGNSNHEGFPADGTSGGAVAIDTVPDISWDWLEENCAPYGLRTFRNVNDEPWHIQPSDIPAGRNYRTEPWDLAEWNLPGTEPLPTPTPEPEEDDDMKTLVLQASDCTADNDQQFWWDGQKIGWVRTGSGRDLAEVVGIYTFDSDGEPFRNLTVQDIQRTITACWSGGPVPAPWTPPKDGYVDTAVS